MSTKKPKVDLALYFYCCHCHKAWLKERADHNKYIQHIKDCLDAHIRNLYMAGLVSFADKTYGPRRIERRRDWGTNPE